MFCNERSIRFRNPRLLIPEIADLASRGVRNIRIIDEMFTLNQEHVEKFCCLVRTMFGDDLNFWAYGRVGTLTPELLKLMRQAGIRWLGVGFESGSQKVLDGSIKNIKLEQALKTADMMRDADICINANWIYGLPRDNYNSMRETLDFSLQINAEWANIYSCMAYPGSKLYEEAKANNRYSIPTEYEAYSQYSYECCPMGTEHLTPAEVLRFRDEAFMTYYTHPNYLGMIKRKFGQETVDYINTITQVKLKRRLLGD